MWVPFVRVVGAGRKVHWKSSFVCVVQAGQSFATGFLVVTLAISCIEKVWNFEEGSRTVRVIWPERSAPVECAGVP